MDRHDKPRKGRPMKEINADLMLHMMRNGASVRSVAKIMGIHRDTLYSRYKHIIRAGRQAYEKFWDDNHNRWFSIEDAARAEEVHKRRVDRMCGATTRRNTECRLAGINNGRCFHHPRRHNTY